MHERAWPIFGLGAFCIQTIKDRWAETLKFQVITKVSSLTDVPNADGVPEQVL